MKLRAFAPSLVVLVAVLAPSGAQAAVPSDPLASTWTYEAIGLPAAWDVTTGSDAVVIAVVDSGVQATHPDLVGAVDPGRDFVDEDDEAADGHGHGTAVAGLAAARANNGVGAAGACWGCRILPLRVVGNEGFALNAVMARAIDYAVEHGAGVVNVSLYGAAMNPFVEDAVRRARAAGVPVLAAAGNESSTAEQYPAAYPEVISVGAIVESGELADYSSRGEWVKLAAPGCSPTTQLGGGFGIGCGTSGAAPLVAGIVGLLRTRFPLATATQIERALTETARPTADVRFGRADAFAALQRLGESAPVLEAVVLGEAVPGQRLTAYSGVWSGAGLEVDYRWERCRGLTCEVAGAGRAYAVSRADGGARLRAVLSAPGFESTTSALSAVVPSRARNDIAPTVSGRAVVGARLTAGRGTWSGSSLRFSYRWVRCADAACRGGRIVGQRAIYVVREGDRGSRLKLVVTATNVLGRATASSRPTARIR